MTSRVGVEPSSRRFHNVRRFVCFLRVRERFGTFGGFWRISKCFGVFRSVPERFGTFHSVLEYFEVFRGVLERFRPFCNASESSRASRSISNRFAAFQNGSEYFEALLSDVLVTRPVGAECNYYRASIQRIVIHNLVICMCRISRIFNKHRV